MPKLSYLGHNLEGLQTKRSSFSDYVRYSHEFNNGKSIFLTHAPEISADPFNHPPKWIDWLMNLRNAIVKPLGLDTESRFTDMISDRNSNEEIFGMPDKHLDFHVSMYCGDYIEGKQELRITTVVKYKNWFGRVYFFIIRPFHGIIISSLLKSIEPK